MTAAASYPWHEALWRRVIANRAAGRLPHALLLAGPAGVGKQAFAIRLSNALVCATPTAAGDACGTCTACRMISAGTHPDQHVVEPEEPGKAIRIEAIRQITGRSVLAAQDQGYRVFLVQPADAMNRAAANALLKTLEEPPARSLLILVSSHPDRLPATIRSRCQTVTFRTPAPELVREWLTGQVEPEAVDGLLAISAGAPLRAIEAQAEDWLGEDRRLAGELGTLKMRGNNPLQTVEEWEKRPLTLLTDGLKRCIYDLVRIASGAREGHLYHPGMAGELQTLAQGIDLQELFSLQQALLELERAAVNNLNSSMMLEHMVNRWLQITREGGR